MRRWIAAIALLLSVSICFAEDYGAYLGVWQTSGEPLKTVEISKDGSTYLLADLRNTTDIAGRKRAPIVLSPAGTQLALNTGMGSAPLGLSGDKNTLYFDKWQFQRVPQQSAMNLKTEIQSAQVARTQNRETCDALGKEFDAKKDAAMHASTSAKAKLAASSDLKKELTARAEQIPDCKRQLLLY